MIEISYVFRQNVESALFSQVFVEDRTEIEIEKSVAQLLVDN